MFTSFFLIIRGSLGVGKTTVAKKVAEQIGGHSISIDDVLAHYGLDQVPEGEPCIPASNFIAAQKKIIDDVKRKLEAGIPVVFDCNFYHKEQIDHLVQAFPYPHRIFTLTASIEACIARDAARERSYGGDAVRAVHAFVASFDAGTVIETTGQSADETVSMLLKALHTSEPWLPK